MKTSIYGFGIQALKNGENAAIPRLHLGFSVLLDIFDSMLTVMLALLCLLLRIQVW